MPDTFTPEQIAQILEEFFKVVGTRQYIGARYVPIFGRKGEDSIEWDNTAPYEPLTIVLYQGNSYTSRQFVPVGVEITNQEFWAITGNYNAQVEMYRRETAAAREVADNALIAANAAQTDINTLLPKSDFSAENTVKKYVDDSIVTAKEYADNINKITYPEFYGAIGDGVTDDTTAFRNMFDAINVEHKPAIIELKKNANYYINVTAHIENVIIIGNGATLNGKDKTALIADSTSHDIIIENCNFNNDVDINNIAYSCAGFSLASSDTSKDYECYNVIVRNCTFNAGVFGFTADNSKNITVDNCRFYDGYYNAPNAAGGYHILEQSCKNFKVTNCTFVFGTYARHAVYVSVNQEKADKQSRNVIIDNCVFDQREMQNVGSARYSPDTRVIMVRATENLKITNCYAYSVTGFTSIVSDDGSCDNIVINNIVCDGLAYYTSAEAPSEARYFITMSGQQSHKFYGEVSNIVVKNADDKPNRALSFVNVNLALYDMTISRVFLNGVNINAHDIVLTEGYGFSCLGDFILSGSIYNIYGPSVQLFNPEANVHLDVIGSEFFSNIYFTATGEIRYITTKPVINLSYEKLTNGRLKITLPNVADNDLMLTALARDYRYTPVISAASWNATNRQFEVLYKDSSGQLINADGSHYYLGIGKF